METTFQKIVVGALLVLLGWIFGQGGELLREWRINRRLQRELFDELKNLFESLKIIELHFRRSLQISTHGIVEGDLALKLGHPIYTNFYKDVCSKLNRSQRESYELIHELINSINKLLDEQWEVSQAFHREPTADRARWWEKLIRSQYYNVRVLHLHLTFHLNHAEKPELELGSKKHREYLQNLETIARDIVQIIEKAKTLNPDDARRIYDPQHFAHLENEKTDDVPP